MANRIIKDSIWTSSNFNQLSVYAERHFYRILMLADDYGCFEATPAVVVGRCYPLQARQISAKKVQDWQNELGRCGLIGYWSEDGRDFGVFLNFDKHNAKYAVTDDGKPTRRHRKTPPPPEDEASLCQVLPEFANPEDFCLIHNPQSIIQNPESRILSPAKAGEIPFNEIISDLNQKTGKNYKPDTPKTQEMIRTLWRRGFTLQDFQQVHTNKVNDWINDKEMARYLRPDTLYSNKFEGYLNQVSVDPSMSETAAHNLKSAEEFLRQSNRPKEIEDAR